MFVVQSAMLLLSVMTLPVTAMMHMELCTSNPKNIPADIE